MKAYSNYFELLPRDILDKIYDKIYEEYYTKVVKEIKKKIKHKIKHNNFEFMSHLTTPNLNVWYDETLYKFPPDDMFYWRIREFAKYPRGIQIDKLKWECSVAISEKSNKSRRQLIKLYIAL